MRGALSIIKGKIGMRTRDVGIKEEFDHAQTAQRLSRGEFRNAPHGRSLNGKDTGLS
jgi:hypothetical protein